MTMTTDEIIKAIEPAWKLFGAMQQRPGARFSVSVEREQLGKAMDALRATAVQRQGLPTPGRYVLAWLEGKSVPIRAMWVPKLWLQAGDECPEGWAEYSEEKDEYFCPEGWYEANEHEETHWVVNKKIVAWSELPRIDVEQVSETAAGGPAA